MQNVKLLSINRRKSLIIFWSFVYQNKDDLFTHFAVKILKCPWNGGVLMKRGLFISLIPNMSQHMEMSAQRNPNSAIATDVSPLRTSLTGRQPPEPPTPPSPTPPSAPTPPSSPTPPVSTPEAPPVSQAPAPAESNLIPEQAPSAPLTPVPDNSLSHQPSQLGGDDNVVGTDELAALLDGLGDGPPEN